MAYSGKYKPRSPKKYKGDPNNVVYRSLWEKYCFMWCDKNKDVKYWSSEEVVIPYVYQIDKKAHRYFMDLKITFHDGRVLLVEIKPKKETVAPTKKGKTKQRFLSESLTYVKNMDKWKATLKYVKERNWDFEIWTEDTLNAKKIMPKSAKPLKKLKPYPKPKRKS